MACFVPLSALVMTPSFHWDGLGWVEIFKFQLGWVSQSMGWVGLGHIKWTHGQLCHNYTLPKCKYSQYKNSFVCRHLHSMANTKTYID